jgi:two-component system, repressor protein LuxO
MSSVRRLQLSSKIIVADNDPVFLRQLSEVVERVNKDTPISEAAGEADLQKKSGSDRNATLVLDPAFFSNIVSAVSKLRTAGHRGRILIAAANSSIRNAVQLVRAGADDILIKPAGRDAIVDALSGLPGATGTPAQSAGEAIKPKTDFGDFVGNSAAMTELYEMIVAVAPSPAPVFITGESGTGKELTARSVHATGLRRNRPFVTLNCSAIPRDLMESEIFGHVKGAFTGAYADRAGAAELADGGILFLDEICEMELALQVKLLRFVQSGSVQRVGETETRQFDIRFICATNRNPREEVAAGRFREDLYYRLNVLPLRLAPLRERKGDILQIAKACLAQYSAEEGTAFLRFTDDAGALLREHPWPGNVRQLENTVRRAVVLNRGDEITSGMLKATMADELFQAVYPGQIQDSCGRPSSPAVGPVSAIEPLAVQERGIIEKTMRQCGGNIVETARVLAVSPSTIYRKMNSWQELARF